MNYLNKAKETNRAIHLTKDLAVDSRDVLHRLRDRLNYAEHHLHQQDMLLQDMLALQLKQVKLPEAFNLKTEHPVAIYSDDHTHPLGTAQDNTRHPRFVGACEKAFGGKLNVLDLGCAGGGLVWDFLLRGHRAMGLEGSDHSLISQRGMWRLLPDHLKTCDITKPFTLDGKFHVISAWEVMEHIPEDLLPGMLANIRDHLRDDGVFVASIATFECADEETGAVWHVTIQDRAWWIETFARHGLTLADPQPFSLADHVRGSGNGPNDWSAALRPDMGFHLC